MELRALRQQEVLSYIIGLGGWVNPVQVSPVEISKDLQVSPEVIRKAIHNLCKRGALHDHGRCVGRYQHRYSATMRCHQLGSV